MNESSRLLLLFAALNGFLFVAFGAFGAHGLENIATQQQLGWFKTGAHYQGIHAIAMAISAFTYMFIKHRLVLIAGWAFLFGIMIFSGSLYLMTLGAPRWLGMVTPIGGSAFLIGWACLFVAVIKQRAKN